MSVCKHQVLTVALQHLLVPSVVGWSIGEVEERQNELLNIIEARQLCQQNGTKGSVVASKGNIVMAKLKETSKNIMEDFNNVDCQEWLSPFQQHISNEVYCQTNDTQMIIKNWFHKFYESFCFLIEVRCIHGIMELHKQLMNFHCSLCQWIQCQGNRWTRASVIAYQLHAFSEWQSKLENINLLFYSLTLFPMLLRKHLQLQQEHYVVSAETCAPHLTEFQDALISLNEFKRLILLQMNEMTYFSVKPLTESTSRIIVLTCSLQESMGSLQICDRDEAKCCQLIDSCQRQFLTIADKALVTLVCSEMEDFIAKCTSGGLMQRKRHLEVLENEPDGPHLDPFYRIMLRHSISLTLATVGIDANNMVKCRLQQNSELISMLTVLNYYLAKLYGYRLRSFAKEFNNENETSSLIQTSIKLTHQGIACLHTLKDNNNPNEGTSSKEDRFRWRWIQALVAVLFLFKQQIDSIIAPRFHMEAFWPYLANMRQYAESCLEDYRIALNELPTTSDRHCVNWESVQKQSILQIIIDFATFHRECSTAPNNYHVDLIPQCDQLYLEAIKALSMEAVDANDPNIKQMQLMNQLFAESFHQLAKWTHHQLTVNDSKHINIDKKSAIAKLLGLSSLRDEWLKMRLTQQKMGTHGITRVQQNRRLDLLKMLLYALRLAVDCNLIDESANLQQVGETWTLFSHLEQMKKLLLDANRCDFTNRVAAANSVDKVMQYWSWIGDGINRLVYNSKDLHIAASPSDEVWDCCMFWTLKYYEFLYVMMKTTSHEDLKYCTESVDNLHVMLENKWTVLQGDCQTLDQRLKNGEFNGGRMSANMLEVTTSLPQDRLVVEALYWNIFK